MNTKSSRLKTLELVEVSLFIAIIVVLAITPFGYIPLGFVNATVIHIPVILAGAVMGWKQGAFLGFVFGLTSFANSTFLKPTITSFLFSPFYPGGNGFSLVICFVPRILIGVVAYLVFKAAIKVFHKEVIALFSAGICGSLINTILVMGGAYIFMSETYAKALGITLDGVGGAVLTVVIANGIPEAMLAGFMTAGVGKVLLAYRRTRGI